MHSSARWAKSRVRRRPAIRIGAAVRGTKRIQLPSKTSIDQGQESSHQGMSVWRRRIGFSRKKEESAPATAKSSFVKGLDEVAGQGIGGARTNEEPEGGDGWVLHGVCPSDVGKPRHRFVRASRVVRRASRPAGVGVK